MAATRAFREGYASTNPLKISEDFSTFEGRALRYQINWAMYENTAYRKVHSWSESYKSAFGLYRFIRNIESPAFRLGDFWQAHIWGGILDAEAGDGKSKPSALPIVTDSKELRKAIAMLWKWSNWKTEKDVVTLRGAVLGDSFIKITDDIERKKVYMSALHPGKVRDVVMDNWGNVKAYVIEETRPHPDNGRDVTYREEAERDGDDVVYRTFMNGSLYAWNGEADTWTVPYGFIPMVMIRHRNVGIDWGWSEMHAGMPAFREVDEQSSLLADQIRKMVNTVWLFSGVSAPSDANGVLPVSPTKNETDSAREDVPALYGPAGATATSLVSNLDITATADRINKMVAKIERDYPELSDDLANASGDISGRALRINRQPIIDRVSQRRPGYDDALVRAQQMAVAIGGWREYDDAFSGFNLDSFKEGKLNHSIAERPVFDKDPLDDLEVEKAFWEAANAAKTAGGMTGMVVFFRKNGWTDEQINEFVNSPENTLRTEAMKSAAEANKNLNEAPPVLKKKVDDGS